MIARADRRAPTAPRWRADNSGLIPFKTVAVVISLFSATPGAAQVGAAVSIFSDDRFRGLSLSGGQPVAIVDLSYDAPSGFYAAGSGTLVASSDEHLRLLGLQLNGGYAKRLGSGLTLDAGAVHVAYSRYSGLSSARSYTEIYAGLAGKLLSSRVYFSPRYFERAATTYAEVDGHLPAVQDFTIEAHAGLLVPLYADHSGHSGSRYDWQVGVSRPAGRFVFHAALSAAGPRQQYYGNYSRKPALAIGVNCAL